MLKELSSLSVVWGTWWKDITGGKDMTDNRKHKYADIFLLLGRYCKLVVNFPMKYNQRIYIGEVLTNLCCKAKINDLWSEYKIKYLSSKMY